ncbi:MAG TPA: zf-TFIIB domain-containing protein [Usitatibacter sp.]|nr:zf-TFIIB domain-containing protein [Usitatibacter sp.]
MTDAAFPAAAGARQCPSCHATMERRAFAGRGPRPVDLDLCLDCQAIWFDAFESAQLTPGAVLQVFDVIREAQGRSQARPVSPVMACPACRHALALTHDFERTNRITYYRCPEGHGRLTTFAQFLLEKNFVRSLSPAEVIQLRAMVTHVRCTSCGAPIDLSRDAVCAYCRAPIAILDADALQGTVAQLTREEQARRPALTQRAAVESLLTLPGQSQTPTIVQDVLQLLFNIA